MLSCRFSFVAVSGEVGNWRYVADRRACYASTIGSANQVPSSYRIKVLEASNKTRALGMERRVMAKVLEDRLKRTPSSTHGCSVGTPIKRVL